MKKDRGFTYIEIIISVVLVLGISYLSVFYYEKLREKQDIQRAKTLILDVYKRQEQNLNLLQIHQLIYSL